MTRRTLAQHTRRDHGIGVVEHLDPLCLLTLRRESPTCGGVWLDTGELDRIKDEVAAKTITAMLPTAPYAAG